MIENIAHRTALAAAVPNAGAASRRTSSSTAQTDGEAGAQYNFASIFGAASDERGPIAAAPSSVNDAIQTATLHTVAATAALVSGDKLGTTENISTGIPTSLKSTPTTDAVTTATPTPDTSETTTPAPVATVANPGIEALVTAIMNGSFKPTNVTDPSKLQETNPAGTDYMPGFYYASDQTAAQMAQLLGGSVVQMPPFGQNKGWSEPLANFIQLPNGQTFNAADVAYYAQAGAPGSSQLMADITQTINEGSAWTNYYQKGGQMPTFATGYVGPAITGMAYPSSMIAGDGTVINPAMQTSGSQGL